MDKEQPLANERVQITKAVFDGLEFIRNSGITNMFDRPTVLSLARVYGAISSMRATAYPVSVVVFGFLLTTLGIERTLILFVILNVLLPVVLAMQPVLRDIPTVQATGGKSGSGLTSPRT